jgi:ferric-dicitrate binding protein FerR (iron transport regulator)
MKENYFLAKWLNKELTDEELTNYVSSKDILAYKKIIATSNNLQTPKFDAENVLNTIKINSHKQKVRKLNFNFAYKVAAAIAIIASSFYFISSKSTVYTTKLAEKTNFTLPDQSKVELNADSKISFKEKNWNTHRNLKLKGEAYFSVKKGSKFTVNTKLGSVSVLGTKFNVIVRGNYFQVTCYRGLVSVSYKNKTIKVPAGTSFKAENNIAEKTFEIENTLPSWIQNFSTFKSMPYHFVIEELQRQYKIKIEYNSELANTLFTGTFTHTNLNLALKAVTVPLNLTFKTISDHKVRFVSE